MNMPGLQVRRLFQGQIGTSWGYWAKAWENQKRGEAVPGLLQEQVG